MRETQDLYRSRGTFSTACNSKEQARSFIYSAQKVEHYIINKRGTLNRLAHHATAYASSLLPTSGVAMWDKEGKDDR